VKVFPCCFQVEGHEFDVFIHLHVVFVVAYQFVVEVSLGDAFSLLGQAQRNLHNLQNASQVADAVGVELYSFIGLIAVSEALETESLLKGEKREFVLAIEYGGSKVCFALVDLV
jgi:hypothetical protein